MNFREEMFLAVEVLAEMAVDGEIIKKVAIWPEIYNERTQKNYLYSQSTMFSKF